MSTTATAYNPFDTLQSELHDIKSMLGQLLSKQPAPTPQQASQERKIINVKQAAARFGVSEGHIYNLFNQKKISGFKRAGLKFYEDELIVWFEAGRVLSKSETQELASKSFIEA